MAMPPKEKKVEPVKKWWETIDTPTSLLIFLFVLAALVAALLNYLERFSIGSPEFLWFGVKNYFLLYIWPIWKIVSAIVSALAIYGIIYNLRKLREIDEIENKIFNPPLSDYNVSPA